MAARAPAIAHGRRGEERRELSLGISAPPACTRGAERPEECTEPAAGTCVVGGGVGRCRAAPALSAPGPSLSCPGTRRACPAPIRPTVEVDAAARRVPDRASHHPVNSTSSSRRDSGHGACWAYDTVSHAVVTANSSGLYHSGPARARPPRRATLVDAGAPVRLRWYCPTVLYGENSLCPGERHSFPSWPPCSWRVVAALEIPHHRRGLCSWPARQVTVMAATHTTPAACCWPSAFTRRAHRWRR